MRRQRGGMEGTEKRMGGRRARQAKDTGKQKKGHQNFTGVLLHCLWGIDATCYPDVVRFVCEEFKDDVKKVEKRRNVKRVE